MIDEVVFNTWSGAYFNPGGGEVQLNNSKLHLEKKGVKVHLYNQWTPQKNVKLLHQFATAYGNEHAMMQYKSIGIKIALSTILWDDVPKEAHFFHHLQNIFNVSDILLTNSNAESHKISKHFDIPLSKFHKTRNAIPDDYILPLKNDNFREKFNINSKYILSVANIDRRKNTHRLVKACEELGKELILIGHIRDHGYFKEIQDNHKQFKHLGPISDIEILKSAYKNCDLHALPSLCETPGIAALEAASQGAKIVITNEGPTEEYFGAESITLVDPLDQNSITSGIEKELKTKRDNSLSEMVKSEYTWDKTADDILKGYSKILNS